MAGRRLVLNVGATLFKCKTLPEYALNIIFYSKHEISDPNVSTKSALPPQVQCLAELTKY